MNLTTWAGAAIGGAGGEVRATAARSAEAIGEDDMKKGVSHVVLGFKARRGHQPCNKRQPRVSRCQ